MDLDLAKATEHLEVEHQDPVLPVSQATPEVLLLTEAVHMLRNLVQQRSKKRIPFPPLPRIRTARHVLAERRRAEHRGRLMSRITAAQQRWATEHNEPPPEPLSVG